MIKSVIKEIIIMLLLCIAIVLIIGILFYDYIPTNKIVPTKQAYETPNNVKEEVNETITELDMEKTTISYEITDADLNIYKQTSSYKPGKANPFELKAEQPENVETDSNNGQNGSSDGEDNVSSGNNGGGDKNSTQTFFNDTK